MGSAPLTSRCFPISPTCLCSLQPSSFSSPLPRVRGRTSAVRRRWLVPPTTPCSPTTAITCFPWPAWTTVSTQSPTPPHPNIALKKVICQLSAYLTQLLVLLRPLEPVVQQPLNHLTA